MNLVFNGLELFSQLWHVLVFVFFDQHAKHVHQRGERMIFIFANFIGDTIE